MIVVRLQGLKPRYSGVRDVAAEAATRKARASYKS